MTIPWIVSDSGSPYRQISADIFLPPSVVLGMHIRRHGRHERHRRSNPPFVDHSALQILAKDPLFQGRDNPDQLVQIAKVLGTDGLYTYMKRFGIALPKDIAMGTYKRKSWVSH